MTQVTPAATFCATLVDSWVALGMTDAVVCPGSRSTPMALALDQNPGIRTHVHQDERSAAFLALGLSLATARPAAVLTTSGTAAVNLHPAVAEAGESAVPLLALTADRPPELHGVGAPQTTDQQRLFGSSVRLFVDAGVPDEAEPDAWRELAAAVYRACVEPTPGPVQVNLPFREPLVGMAGELPVGPPEGWTSQESPPPSGPVWEALLAALPGASVLAVAGGGCDGAEVSRLGELLGWPVLADPRSGIPAPAGVGHFDALLRSRPFAETVGPDVVLRFGSLPASKVLGSWLDGLDAQQFGIDRWGRTFDPGDSLTGVIAASDEDVSKAVRDHVAVTPEVIADRERWFAADAVAAAVIDSRTRSGSLSDPAVARALTRCWDGPIQVSSSMPVRDLEWYGIRRGSSVYANRGINGIDGVVSTAVGLAAGTGEHVACLLGDLAFLHDHSGLLGLADRPIDLTLVIADNDGGAIFGFLPQATELDSDRFERLFGTPHGLDLVEVASAGGLPTVGVATVEELEAALGVRAAEGGVGVIVARTDRGATVATHDELHTCIAEALTSSALF